MILAAIAKIGFIADLISKPTMIGYLNGLALTILVGQLPKLFGFKVEAEGLIGEVAHFIKGLADGKVVAAAAVVGIAGIVVIMVLQRWLPKVPRHCRWLMSRERCGCGVSAKPSSCCRSPRSWVWHCSGCFPGSPSR